MKAILSEIERAYGLLNKHLFGNSLRIPIFTLLPHKKGVVRFIPEDFEITVGSDVGRVDQEALLYHLLHEMVHVSNFQKGVVDCRQGQYHNIKFRDVALAVGLTVSRDRSHGWGLTNESGGDDKKHPSIEANKHREEAFIVSKISEKILKEAQKEILVVRKRTFFLKYECNCQPPHNSIRSGRRPDGEHPLNIKCMCCNSYFQCVETT